MLTVTDLANLLKLIDRALKADAQPGGLADHMATASLIIKLQQMRKVADTADGKDTPTGN